MRVGVVLEQVLAPVPGGTGRYSREVATALARVAAPGDGVEGWVAWHSDVSRAQVAGLVASRRLPLPRRALTLLWERGAGPAPRGVDLVHAPTLLVPPRSGRPLVVTIHDAVPWTHPQTLTRRGAVWHRQMARRAAAQADAVVVPTAAVAEEVSRYVSVPQVHVVGEGVAATLAVPPDAARRARRIGLPPRYFVSVGTLEPRKGLDVAIRAVASGGGAGLPLLVVGQAGWGGVDLRGARVETSVRWLGRVDDADLAVVLSRATALIAPSRSEGFGLPVLEAMALGTPVVASAAPALVEVAAGAAIHVPVDDVEALTRALAAVADDEPLRRRMAEAGRARATCFSWDQCARRLWRLYDDVLGR